MERSLIDTNELRSQFQAALERREFTTALALAAEVELAVRIRCLAHVCLAFFADLPFFFFVGGRHAWVLESERR